MTLDRVRRKRRPGPKRQKAGEISVSYGYTKEQGEDIYFTHGDGTARADARLLNYFFCSLKPFSMLDKKHEPSLIEQLKERGYDIRTIRFTIQKATVEPQERRDAR